MASSMHSSAFSIVFFFFITVIRTEMSLQAFDSHKSPCCPLHIIVWLFYIQRVQYKLPLHVLKLQTSIQSNHSLLQNLL